MSLAPEKMDQGQMENGLDRHDQRRRAGVPTVSVLAGPIRPTLVLARNWTAELERPMVLVRLEQTEAESVVVPWVDRLAAGRDLIDAAVGWLAKRLNQPAGLLGRRLRAMTAYEVDRLFNSAVQGVSETGLEQVAFRLIEQAARGRQEFQPGLASELNTLLDGHGPPWVRVFRALGELVPQECLPVLTVAPTRQDPANLNTLARLLADLAEAQPVATLLLIVESADFDSYLNQTTESRAKALLRRLAGDSLVAGDGWRGAGDEGKEKSEVIPTEAHPESDDPSLATNDQARSAAERFLFDMLESLPETVGQFELNAKLDFPFAVGRPTEVDLLARSLRMVIEIDGYYHFQDPEAYRRDRRKDLELQKRGFLVLRVLANDVVDRLEELLETVTSAVAFCRYQQRAR